VPCPGMASGKQRHLGVPGVLVKLALARGLRKATRGRKGVASRPSTPCPALSPPATPRPTSWSHPCGAATAHLATPATHP
jgi:hypothetical protein